MIQIPRDRGGRNARYPSPPLAITEVKRTSLSKCLTRKITAGWAGAAHL